MKHETFQTLALHASILRAVKEEGYGKPTEIQQAAIPHVLAGKDLLATAQTGTGKTAAFALPLLHLLNERKPSKPGHIRALILTPTRELALQIEASLRAYGRHLRLRTTVLLGGVPDGAQIKALRRKPDILVATPGRLLDLRNRGYVRLGHAEKLVLDEADRMLDMGFIRDVRKIVADLPKDRQTLFCSATLSGDVTRFASDMLRSPVTVSVAPPATAPESIAQKVLFVKQMDKNTLLADILKDGSVRRALVFTRTKHRANRVMQQLSASGISADAIHSNKSQGARQRALAAFHRGAIKVLVGTDIVARGIDVDDISHVINYELPQDPECYIHRIGRTARAGADGIALSFCDAAEVPLLKDIETLTRHPLTPFEDHRFHATAVAALHHYASMPSASRKKPANGPRFGRTRRPARARR